MLGPERTLLRDRHRYIAHPHLARLRDGSWLLVATCGPCRAVTLHPPLDPAFITIGIWSDDEGETWSDPVALPADGMAGTECSGLTALPDGGVMLNQWRFRWHDAAVAGAGIDDPFLVSADDLTRQLEVSRELDGVAPEGTIRWARGGGTLALWRSEASSRCWTKLSEPDLAPFSGGYGLRGGLLAANGDLLLPLTDPPHYSRVFLIRSRDGGRSWGEPEPVATAQGAEFEEPSAVLLHDGAILMLLRENVGRDLQFVRSGDHGARWSPPRPAGLAGFPAHLVRLVDGRLAALTAVRTAPGAILLAVSADEGATWDGEPVVVAGDLGTHDLGYPTGVSTRDGSVFAAYYRRDALGVTGVYARHVQVPNHA